MKTLAEELAALTPDLTDELGRHRFDAQRLIELSARLSEPLEVINREKVAPDPLRAGDVALLPGPDTTEAKALERRGLELLGRGDVVFVVLAGGMATRMGGGVKALVPALPGRTFLSLRLAERAALERRVGREVPLWLMTSAATDARIREALGSELDGQRTAVFPQALSLRLTREGRLFRDASGAPSPHAHGHGDLFDALRASGLLERFLTEGGRTLCVGNLDNLGATMDPLLLGFHVAHGKPVTCEVVDRLPTDRGGTVLRFHGRPAVIEEFRLPAGFDPGEDAVFSTNTFHFDASALADLGRVPWTYFAVEKRVDGRLAIQFERLVNEVTSHLEARYVRVPRTGPESRFLPVKDARELSARQREIEAVLHARWERA